MCIWGVGHSISVHYKNVRIICKLTHKVFPFSIIIFVTLRLHTENLQEN